MEDREEWYLMGRRFGRQTPTPRSTFPNDGAFMDATDDPDARLNTNPHYTDERFRHAQTIYGRQVEGLHYDYSDRLWQWDYAKAEEAVKAANASGAPSGSARWLSAYLTAFHGKPAEVLHVMAGWDWATGYAYAIYGYRFT